MLCIYEIYISNYAVVCKHSGFLLTHEVIRVLSLSLSKISKEISLSEGDNIKNTSLQVHHYESRSVR